MEVEKKMFDIDLFLDLGTRKKRVVIQSPTQRIGIIGPSGCGKSSLGQALAGINSRVSGHIKFQDEYLLNSLNKIFIPPWKRSVGYAPQDFQLIPHLSVEKNILFPQRAQFIEEVIEGLKIGYLLNRMPRNLSGGEKQRTSLARALCSSPKLLILDEPFSALDREIKYEVIQFLDQYITKMNMALFLISHGETELRSLKMFSYQF